MVLLIGNYVLDRQQSMLRFATMMIEGLRVAGVPAELIAPEPVLGSFRGAGGFIAKWLAYVDKFLLFPRRLRAALKKHNASLVHICDHSNAMYGKHAEGRPVVVTCHDLLAVRGALGDDTDTPASMTGTFLQRWILAGLQHATAIACVSKATCDDARRLVARDGAGPTVQVITLGLSYPYRRLSREDAEKRLASVSAFAVDRPFVLHVGSNLRRKNRDAVLRIFARCKEAWQGQLVFAGELLDAPLVQLAQQLGVADRIVQVPETSNETLEALYSLATALLFPSRFEGFGWPIAEAQACGCPVLCSSTPPMSEVAGAGALLREPHDEEGFAADLLRLLEPEEHQHWSARALANAARFSTSRMIDEYIALYRSLTPAC